MGYIYMEEYIYINIYLFAMGKRVYIYMIDLLYIYIYYDFIHEGICHLIYIWKRRLLEGGLWDAVDYGHVEGRGIAIAKTLPSYWRETPCFGATLWGGNSAIFRCYRLASASKWQRCYCIETVTLLFAFDIESSVWLLDGPALIFIIVWPALMALRGLKPWEVASALCIQSAFYYLAACMDGPAWIFIIVWPALIFIMVWPALMDCVVLNPWESPPHCVIQSAFSLVSGMHGWPCDLIVIAWAYGLQPCVLICNCLGIRIITP